MHSNDVECAVAPSPAAVLTPILCETCNGSIEAPRDDTSPLQANEEWLEECGWDLRGYLAYCPTCVSHYPTCDHCHRGYHPHEMAQREPVALCCGCAESASRAA